MISPASLVRQAIASSMTGDASPGLEGVR
jgi:hypothetical protein